MAQLFQVHNVNVAGHDWRIREMSGHSRVKFFALSKNGLSGGDDPTPDDLMHIFDMQVFILSVCVIGEDDKPAYSVDEIKDWPASVITPLADECLALNGLAGNVVEDAKKN